MIKNILLGVRCLYNTEDVSVMELDTYFGKQIIKLNHNTIPIPHGEGVRYEYPTGIKEYCIEHDIEYRDYFNMLHKDCK